ncbi:related to pisatin demethylase / cytochrome P450 monooxygenase [Cephalotrichum gorgonifer]|uniref:Related to pisatin demethylase / cytochrome P450 monooxygenase n=1 Tax=Cephalotrichum gorgonifer TaxID=2041049 RepID=A0AAE8SUJ0_9PEZI|nr:related to pisatin demethylase / cytochrome P450 monooxygenase [Cephalotrichum gorgonifer]
MMLLLLAVVVIAAYSGVEYLSRRQLPTSLPRIRSSGQSISLKTRWAYLTDCRQLFLDTYQSYSKVGKTCILPSMGFRDEVHISAQHTQWAASQPDSVLSAIEGFREIDKGDWNSGHAKYIQDPWQSVVIKKDMGRFLETIAAAVHDELGAAMSEYLDVDGEKDVDVYEAMKWIVAQISSRFTVGLPLCRDKDYLRQSLAFADLFILNSGLLIYTPSFLKPFVGFLVTIPTRYRRWRIKQYIAPLYKSRLHHLMHPDVDAKYVEPADTLQLMIRHALEKAPQDLSLGHVSDRLCLANLASFHQTAVAISNILINIAASNAEFETADVLRREMTAVLSAHGGVFSKAAAARMVHTDSVLRESMRTHAFGARAMIRKVVAPGGVVTPDGHVLPQGSTLSVLAYPVHHDPEIYGDPEKFDPFRFSRQRGAASTSGPDGTSKGPSFLNGHWAASVKQPAGLPFRDWSRTIPNNGLIRYLHLLNRERIIVTSPKGLSEVLSQNSYDYVKPHLLRAMVGKILGYGLLLSEGDVHKMQRKNLMPAFSFRHIKELYPIFWSKAQELVAGIETEMKESPGSSVDVADWASRASLDIIGSAGMDHEFKSLSDPTIEDTMKMYGSMIKQSRGAKLLVALQLILPSFITDYLPFQRNMGVLAASKAARATSMKLINTKRGQMARGEEKPAPNIISTALESGHFTDEGLVDTMMTFLAAGHETSAAALTWTICLLAQHKDIQDRLRREIRESLPGGLAQAMDAKTLDGIAYLHAVCQESLRLYAPIPFTVRDANRDTTILGQFVPKGTMVILCPWATNRAEELWGADADAFNPERWMTAGGQANNSGGAKSNYAYLTFLHGPRSCIGQKFAVAELMALTCALVGRFEFELPEGGEVRDITDGIVAKPKDGLRVLVRRHEGGW